MELNLFKQALSNNFYNVKQHLEGHTWGIWIFKVRKLMLTSISWLLFGVSIMLSLLRIGIILANGKLIVIFSVWSLENKKWKKYIYYKRCTLFEYNSVVSYMSAIIICWIISEVKWLRYSLIRSSIIDDNVLRQSELEKVK